ncbi:MAG: methyltransferase domain-containing protein [Gemmatimonas sp.]
MQKLAGAKRGFEYLDDPALPPEIAARSLKDVAVANALFGGTRAILAEARATFGQQRDVGVRCLTLLDVGTGLGDIPAALRIEATRFGIQLRPFGLEITATMASLAPHNNVEAVAGDARALPFRNDSVDVVTCSLVLHHLDDADALLMLRECSRVARVRVIVADLRRSWLALALLWLVSFPLRFHPISRHDGMVSIRRGFTVAELRALIGQACNCKTECLSRLGWRVTASFKPGTIVDGPSATSAN